MTWVQLKNLTLGQSQETIPRFSQVLELVHDRVPLLVELKMKGLESFHPYVLY